MFPCLLDRQASDADHQTEGVIDRGFIRKGGGHIRGKQHEIGPPGKPLGILATDAFLEQGGKIVFGTEIIRLMHF